MGGKSSVSHFPLCLLDKGLSYFYSHHFFFLQLFLFYPQPLKSLSSQANFGFSQAFFSPILDSGEKHTFPLHKQSANHSSKEHSSSPRQTFCIVAILVLQQAHLNSHLRHSAL